MESILYTNKTNRGCNYTLTSKSMYKMKICMAFCLVVLTYKVDFLLLHSNCSDNSICFGREIMIFIYLKV